MRTIAIYPGRWQPWHKGHKASYDYLVAQYGLENVYITSTDVTDSYKSPFTFEEKKEMMVLSGIPADKILLVKQQYNLKAVAPLIAGFNMNTDRVLFAISRKDMLSDPRFNNFMLKSGQPAYLQPAPEDVTKIEPAVKHGYLIVVPTKMFSVLGNAVKSASGLRDMYKKLTPEKKKQFIIDLFGKFDKNVFTMLNNKLSGNIKLKPIAEALLEAHGEYKGWKLTYYPIGSQHWKASRFGVNMCANSKELLIQMIDNRKDDLKEDDSKPLESGWYEYRILGIAPEVPEGHEFRSKIADLENHPYLWADECPYSFRDRGQISVKKNDALKEDDGEIAPHSKDAQRANVLAATQMIKAKQFNTKDAQDSLKTAKDKFLNTKSTDEPDVVDRAKETMKQKELSLKAQKNNLAAAQKKLVAVKQGSPLS